MPLHPAASNAPEEPLVMSRHRPYRCRSIRSLSRRCRRPPLKSLRTRSRNIRVPADGAKLRFPMPVKPSSRTAASPESHQTLEPADRGPIAEMLMRGIALIRSDAYTLFLGAAGLVILILLAALWLLPPS